MAYAHRDVLADRHRRLRQTLVDRELDALIVTRLPNVFYLSNFTGSSAVLLMARDALFFITDFRYVAAVEADWASPSGCPNATLVRVETSYDETLGGLLTSGGFRRVGFEAAHVPVAQYGRWTTMTGQPSEVRGQKPEVTGTDDARVELIATERIIEAQRVRKDAHEVATLRRAGEILTGAFGRILAEVQPGRTERQVAAHVDWILKDAGFERSAFDTIVASGPNAALPHARPGARRLGAGDLVVLDFGGVYDGYCVDLTRTVSVGDPDVEARRIYAAVVDAHRAGTSAVRPGATVREIDRAARGALERLGLGDAFGHGTGHGLGIEVHEEPWLRKTQPPGERAAPPTGPTAAPPDVVVEPGMVFTIEPGAYLPGWGGARLEDDLLVTDEGAEMLTHVARDLAIV